MIQRLFLICSSVFMLLACTANEKEFGVQKVIEAETVEIKRKKSKENLGELKLAAAKGVQWLTCDQGLKNKPWALVISGSKSFASKGACSKPVAQALLGASYNVVAFNRHGHGKSKWSADLGGDESLKNLERLLAYKKISVEGVWSEGFGSILASRYAKKTSTKWIILGSGVFDLEALLEDSQNKGDLGLAKKVVSREGDDGMEKRSIAWDFEGFPHFAFVYQPQILSTSRLNISKSFVEGLSVEGHKASLKLINSKSDVLTDLEHGNLIQNALQSFMQTSK